MNGWLSAERKKEAWLIMKKKFWSREFIRQIVVYLTENEFIDIPPYIVADLEMNLTVIILMVWHQYLVEILPNDKPVLKT